MFKVYSSVDGWARHLLDLLGLNIYQVVTNVGLCSDIHGHFWWRNPPPTPSSIAVFHFRHHPMGVFFGRHHPTLMWPVCCQERTRCVLAVDCWCVRCLSIAVLVEMTLGCVRFLFHLSLCVWLYEWIWMTKHMYYSPQNQVKNLVFFIFCLKKM